MAPRRGDWVRGILLATVLFNGVFLLLFLATPLFVEPGLERDLLWVNLALRAGATALGALAYAAHRRQPQLAGFCLLGAVLFILASNALGFAMEGIAGWQAIALWLGVVLFMDWTVLVYVFLSYRFVAGARGGLPGRPAPPDPAQSPPPPPTAPPPALAAARPAARPARAPPAAVGRTPAQAGRRKA